jgi:hypothetical protein
MGNAWRGCEVCYIVGVEDELSTPRAREQIDARQGLLAVRTALLDLHKALLESERASYEQAFGQIGSSYQFLQLLTTDPWFAWLQPVTQLIAAMDSSLDAKEPLTFAGVAALLERTRALLMPSAAGEGFSRHYDEALQRDPDVVFAHANTARMMRNAELRRQKG